MNTYGYNGKILWVDLSDRSYRVETPEEHFWRLYGGGGLAATYLLLRHTDPGIDPLGPDNLLIFASSVVAGMDAPGLARFTTAAKSPLTGGIGETRTEGSWGPALKACGVDILVFSGRAADALLVEIGPGEGGIRVVFYDAGNLWGTRSGRPWTRSRAVWEKTFTWLRSARRASVWSGLPPSSRTGRFRSHVWAWAR